MTLELVWLKTWVEVVDAGSFSRAAEAIHLSQPRVSAHIANLERTLGCVLIERRVRPIALTDEGQALLPKARAVLAAAAELAEIPSRGAKLSGNLRIASFASASASFMPSVLRTLRDAHPDLSVSIFDGDLLSIEAALADRRVSLALRPLRPEPRERSFEFHPLWREPFVALLPDGHALLDESSVTLRQLASAHVITIGNPLLDSSLGHEAETALHSSYAELAMGSVSHQPATLAAMVRAGLGVGVVNQLAVDMVRTDGLQIRPIDDFRQYRDVGLWWHSERPLSRAAMAFRDAVIATPLPTGTVAIPSDR